MIFSKLYIDIYQLLSLTLFLVQSSSRTSNSCVSDLKRSSKSCDSETHTMFAQVSARKLLLIFTQLRWTLAWWAIFELEEGMKNTWRMGKLKPKRETRDEKWLHHRRRKVEMMTRFLDTPFIPSSFFLLSFNFPSFFHSLFSEKCSQFSLFTLFLLSNFDWAWSISISLNLCLLY